MKVGSRERVTPVQMYRLDLLCPKCGVVMQTGNFSYDTNPPQYDHDCPKCKHIERGYGIYPRIIYEDITKEKE